MLAVASQEIPQAKKSLEERWAEIEELEREARVAARMESRKKFKARQKKGRKKRK